MAKGHIFPVYKNSTLSWIHILKLVRSDRRNVTNYAWLHFTSYTISTSFAFTTRWLPSPDTFFLSSEYSNPCQSVVRSGSAQFQAKNLIRYGLYRSIYNRGRKFNGYIKNSKPIQGAWLCKELLRELICWLNFPPWCESQQTKAKYIFETLPKRLLQSGEKQLTRFSTIYLRLPFPFHQVVDMSAPLLPFTSLSLPPLPARPWEVIYRGQPGRPQSSFP